MNGCLYLIRNGDLYKIGITNHFDNRMRQLKPDEVISKIYSKDYKSLEREFHKRYRSVRIPQTEYFRLNPYQIKEIKQSMDKLQYDKLFILMIFIKSFLLSLFIFIFIFLFLSLIIKDTKELFYNSFLSIEKISLVLTLISLFIKSDKKLGLLNEIKLRSIRVFSFILINFIMRFALGYFS